MHGTARTGTTPPNTFRVVPPGNPQSPVRSCTIQCPVLVRECAADSEIVRNCAADSLRFALRPGTSGSPGRATTGPTPTAWPEEETRPGFTSVAAADPSAPEILGVAANVLGAGVLFGTGGVKPGGDIGSVLRGLGRCVGAGTFWHGAGAGRREHQSRTPWTQTSWGAGAFRQCTNVRDSTSRICVIRLAHIALEC